MPPAKKNVLLNSPVASLVGVNRSDQRLLIHIPCAGHHFLTCLDLRLCSKFVSCVYFRETLTDATAHQVS
jgi:hypothetical protein